MEKSDLSRKYKTYYTTKNKSELLEIEKAQFLSITGKGDPSDKQFAEKIMALYVTAYTIKSMGKAMEKDFTIVKLECLWSFDEQKYKNTSLSDAPAKIPRDEWIYRLMIRMPDYVIVEQIVSAIQQVSATKQWLYVKEIEYFEFEEGESVQIFHARLFEHEPDTLQKLHECMKSAGLEKNGLHHQSKLSTHVNH